MSHRENITRIKAVYNALEELEQEVVFVGGATVSLYADRSGEEVRPTNDVDILIELLNYKGYQQLETKLREKGFVNDQESKVICRYKIHGIIVDVMPTSEEILGFSNKWYKQGFANAMDHSLEDGYIIRLFKPAYFIATKLEAFKNRGQGDGRTSSDFEDIVYLLNNRTTIWRELQETGKEVREYLHTAFTELLHNAYLEEWIGANMAFPEKGKVAGIINQMKEFTR
ncbi:hypothetical protein SAMN05518672_101468 [Chitinophaga sp. CF118]|uniref:hypothetical protein n=1 Tax=Chitinophaga sp. CF118 TaxID=1884367 RepID=UPI0008E6C354|nr:hypothetical protein [Chitinophaga sp. CF118]SFD09955.1 hypothetical protein SAMN05518672_101468 [Chitinophaga sp. CF118]